MNFNEFVNHQEDMDFFHRFLHTLPLKPCTSPAKTFPGRAGLSGRQG
jgi:hypothetical protein